MQLCGVIEGFYGRPWTMSQRQELFRWMQAWGMNTYMYAPKDDLKMRAVWRELYDPAELGNLSSLLKDCQSKGIAFIYTIAPGLDILYSDEAEVKALCRKTQQLLDIGIEHFCILFDDIPFALQSADSARFGSFAQAQAHVSNALYRFIQEQTAGLFLFCPTDYCARMCQPSVAASSYLQELGDSLEAAIDIFWTGPEIVSETISEASIQELSAVLKRKPLIWDNLHANDYDIRRAYLGPFAGRPNGLKQQLRGILSNPNNEFELNFVPLRTLALYVQEADYQPAEAYRMALAEWLPRFTIHGAEPIRLDELELLGDLLYLPFQHGDKAIAILSAAREILVAEPQDSDSLAKIKQAALMCEALFKKLTELDNRELLYTLYSYVWELRHELAYLAQYLRWRQAGSPGGRFGKPESLPNTYRGGFVAEIERLVPLDESQAFRSTL